MYYYLNFVDNNYFGYWMHSPVHFLMDYYSLYSSIDSFDYWDLVDYIYSGFQVYLMEILFNNFYYNYFGFMRHP
jgi:hypothetical protein